MNTKKQAVSGILIVLFVLAFFLAFQHKKLNQEDPISATAFKLNTIIEITIYDSKDEALLNDAIALCDTYEKIFSRTLPSSELYQLNHKTLPREKDAFLLSRPAAELIAKGLEYSRLSNGGFDITIEPVSSLWDFTSEENFIPAQSEIENALPLVNYENVILDGDKLTFLEDEMSIDLGAIAKGYIADEIKDFLVSKGVKSATINLGGNVLCIGKHPDGKSFRIGIQKPFAERNETAAVLNVKDKSVVSSGVYERYFKQNEHLYHHILDPKTGFPYENGLISVTIISDKSTDGDGLSTSCFALGLEKGMELINSLPDTEALFITDDYQMHYSRGFASYLAE